MNTHKIMIDYEKCTGCKQCYRACYVDVIRWDKDNKRPIVAYPEECATCSWCELTCPEEAIQVIPSNPISIPEPYPRSYYPKSYVKQ